MEGTAQLPMGGLPPYWTKSVCCKIQRSKALLSAVAKSALVTKIFGGHYWVFAYRHSVDWLSSMLIELALLEALAFSAPDYASDREQLLATFALALSKFNPAMPLGSEGEPLEDCISLIQRAKYKHSPENLTDALIDLAWGTA
jgi:hypothetical protein